jgi:hypothetical protein
VTRARFWYRSNRFDPSALPLADRHYNRQKVGSPQFVPPGRCLVLITADERALWVSSSQRFVRHAWPGAWVNSLFRKESDGPASEMIREAVAITRGFFGEPSAAGVVTFVDPAHVRPTTVRGEKIYGYSYLKAGFHHVGFTKVHGLWVWQLLPADMPAPLTPLGELELSA